jgi:KAP family P-loop domain
MWPDNETDRDFLNFEGVADTVAEIVHQAAGRPISIGIAGAWGVGKSSMIRLIRTVPPPEASGHVTTTAGARPARRPTCRGDCSTTCAARP